MCSLVDIKELLEYNKQVRQRYLQALTSIPWEELIKNREASFNSIRNIFVHTLKAIDYWLDILLKESGLKRMNSKAFPTRLNAEATMDNIVAVDPLFPKIMARTSEVRAATIPVNTPTIAPSLPVRGSSDAKTHR